MFRFRSSDINVWLIALCFTCTATSPSLNTKNVLSSPRMTECTEDGLFPAEQCNQFLLCVTGAAPIPLDCQRPGTNFNPATQECEEDYVCDENPETDTTTTEVTSAPETSDANDTTPPDTSDPTEDSSPTDPSLTTLPDGFLDVLQPDVECPSDGAFYRIHAQDCTLFYYCRDGVERLQRCPFAHIFDMHTGKCLLRDQATCFGENV